MIYSTALRSAFLLCASVAYAQVPNSTVVDLGYAQYQGIYNETSGFVRPQRTT